MNLFYEAYRNDAGIMVNKNLINAIGKNATLLFGELLSKKYYYEEKGLIDNGWFYEVSKMVELNTGLSYYEQKKAENILIKEGLLKTDVRGIPAKKYYFIIENEDNLRRVLNQGKLNKEKILREINALKPSFQNFKNYDLNIEEIDRQNFNVINNRELIKEELNNTYIVENEENLTEKENIKEKEKTENIRSLTENTPSLLETSKNIETSKEKPTKKKPLKAEKIKNKEIVEEIIAYLNEKANKHFRTTNKEAIKLINGRLSEGYSISDLKAVIDNRVEKWLNDEKMNEYLRPSTLFRPSKFEAYYNDVLSMREKANSEREKEFIKKFSVGLTPPDLPPVKALEKFKEKRKINIMTENDFKILEQWYKEKIVEWNKKFSEKIRNERMVELDERAKNQTNERAERYLRNFDKPRKLL